MVWVRQLLIRDFRNIRDLTLELDAGLNVFYGDQLSTVSRSQEQDHQRVDAVLRRLESVERVKNVEAGKPRVDELAVRVQKLESKLAKLEESAGLSSLRSDVTVPDAAKTAKQTNPPVQGESPSIVAGMPGITPTSAFNLAYNDFLNGKYDLAVAGFQRFIKDFPGTSLTPNAHYWLGESLYNQKDYARAATTFEYLVAEYPGNEKFLRCCTSWVDICQLLR